MLYFAELLLPLHPLGTVTGRVGCHPCPSCGRVYKVRSSLNRHVRYECGAAKKQQQCNICGKKYTRPEYVREHYHRRHPLATYEQYQLC